MREKKPIRNLILKNVLILNLSRKFVNGFNVYRRYGTQNFSWPIRVSLELEINERYWVELYKSFSSTCPIPVFSAPIHHLIARHRYGLWSISISVLSLNDADARKVRSGKLSLRREYNLSDSWNFVKLRDEPSADSLKRGLCPALPVISLTGARCFLTLRGLLSGMETGTPSSLIRVHLGGFETWAFCWILFTFFLVKM